MKKITRYAAAVVATALALVSCNKNESGLFGGGKTRITIGARPEEAQENTKTLLSEEAAPTGGSVYHSKWSNSGEELGVIFGAITDKSKSIKLTAEETTDNDPIFTGNATLDDGTYNMFLFYPASAFEKCYDTGTVGLNLKAVQHPVLGTFDPFCDIMSWSTDNAVVENSSFTLEGITLARPTAILRVNLNAPTGGGKAREEGIGSVTGFKMEVAPGETSSEKVTLTGRAALVPDTGEINNWNVENNYVEASIDAAEMITIGESEGFQSVYLIVNPATIPSGREITFSVETEKYSGVNKIVRTVTAPADMVFEAGKVNTINLTLRDKDFPAEVIDEDYNGDWLITGVKNNVTYAALAYSTGNNIKASAALTFSADGSTISSDTDLADCIMTFTKVTEGDYAGMYTIQDANGKYLYAAASGSNYLKAKDEPDVNAYWTVTMEGEDYSIIASKSSNRNVMRFNPNGNNDPLVSCYGSASQSPVKLYPASMISGGSPVVTSTTVADILEGGAGSYSKVENLLVYAVSGKNVIVGDSTGKMLLFMDNTLKVGDNITITNAVTTVYSQVVLEITGGTIATNSSGNTVNHGTAVAIDDATTCEAQLNAFSATGFHSAIYVAMIGDQSGRNIQGSNAKLYLSQANDATNNKRVETLGYVYAYSSSHSNFYYQAVSITEYTEPGAPSLSVSPNELSWATNEYGQSSAKEVTVTLNAEVDEDNYTISGSDDNWVVTPYGGNGGTISVYPKTANTGSSARTFSFDVVHADDNTVKQTVTCTQASNTAITIAAILEGGAKTHTGETGELLVYAVTGSNAIVGDSTGKMLLYKSGHGLAVGDIFTITNPVTTVYQTVVLEITNGTFNKKSSGNTVSHGTAVAIDDATTFAAQKTAFSATGFHSAVYVAMIGDQSGRNIQGSNAKLYLNQANDATNNKRVETTGYIYAYSSSYSNFNYQAVSIAEFVDDDTPSISADVTSLTWASNEYGTSAAKSIKVTINANASGYTFSWGVGRNDVFDVVDNGDNTVSVYPIAANTSTTEDLKSALRIEHKENRDLYAEIALTQYRVPDGSSTTVTDVLNNAFTGVTGTSYASWTKTGTSGTIYSGQSAGSNSSIQLRSNNSNSGIVTTESVGSVKSITVTWNDNTTGGRTLDIYGKASAYSAPTDLYNSSTQGTKLGTIVKGTSTTLTVSGDYDYIGLRSNSGAMYIDKIEIVWEK